MNAGTDNQAERNKPTAPVGEQYGPGLSGRVRKPITGQDVMDTLLGQNKLAAYDASGNDPYNTTGKFFRR
jgi:hypothetical protein